MRILFLTGRLAEAGLRRMLDSLPPSADDYEVRNIGVSVAALMTADMIRRRLKKEDVQGVGRVIVPGLCGGDLAAVSEQLGVAVARGPAELLDLPEFLGRGRRPPPRLDRYDVRIFAEIVDAPILPVSRIVQRAQRYREDGADVIDLGFLPGRPFPRLEEAIQALHAEGMEVSVDTMEEGELLRAGRAGADYMLSLCEKTLWIAEEVASVPVVIPGGGGISSLYRALDWMQQRGRRCLADSILDPIHFGFTESLVRYRNLRRRFPEVEIMMGVGNLTELTEADTGGINALLMGVASELQATAILSTEVSPHARSAIYEADRARRILYAAREEQGVPKGYSTALTGLHERRPLFDTQEDIAELAARIRDPSYRIRVAEEGLFVFNRDGLHRGRDPFALFPELASLQEDAPHAFYMGVELARAQIAWQLGKRYRQDRMLDWGAALPPARRKRAGFADEEGNAAATEGTTLQASRRQRRARQSG